jgi:hypothetical protein
LGPSVAPVVLFAFVVSWREWSLGADVSRLQCVHGVSLTVDGQEHENMEQ